MPLENEPRAVLEVTELRMTCGGCPSQWEGLAADGRYVYVRYRWGNLTVETGATPEDAVWGASVFDKQIGDGLDGFLDMDGLRAATAGVVLWPETVGGEAPWG